MTSNRVLFVPNRLNARRNREVHQWPIGAIDSVGTEERDYTLYTGGMKKRMRITLADGEAAVFVVKELDETIKELQAAIGDAKSSMRRSSPDSSANRR